LQAVVLTCLTLSRDIVFQNVQTEPNQKLMESALSAILHVLHAALAMQAHAPLAGLPTHWQKASVLSTVLQASIRMWHWISALTVAQMVLSYSKTNASPHAQVTTTLLEMDATCAILPRQLQAMNALLNAHNRRTRIAIITVLPVMLLAKHVHQAMPKAALLVLVVLAIKVDFVSPHAQKVSSTTPSLRNVSPHAPVARKMEWLATQTPPPQHQVATQLQVTSRKEKPWKEKLQFHQ